MSGRRSALALLALVVVMARLAQTSHGHSLLKDAGLYQEPASYTGLAFTAPDKLPGQLTSKRTPVGVAFRIHNASGSSRSYRWSITLVRSARNIRRRPGSFTQPPSEKSRLPEP